MKKTSCHPNIQRLPYKIRKLRGEKAHKVGQISSVIRGPITALNGYIYHFQLHPVTYVLFSVIYRECPSSTPIYKNDRLQGAPCNLTGTSCSNQVSPPELSMEAKISFNSSGLPWGTKTDSPWKIFTAGSPTAMGPMKRFRKSWSEPFTSGV